MRLIKFVRFLRKHVGIVILPKLDGCVGLNENRGRLDLPRQCGDLASSLQVLPRLPAFLSPASLASALAFFRSSKASALFFPPCMLNIRLLGALGHPSPLVRTEKQIEFGDRARQQEKVAKTTSLRGQGREHGRYYIHVLAKTPFEELYVCILYVYACVCVCVSHSVSKSFPQAGA